MSRLKYKFCKINMTLLLNFQMIVAGVVGIQLWRKGEEHRTAEDCPEILKQLVSDLYLSKTTTTSSA